MKRICVWGTSIKKIADEAQSLAFTKILKSKIPDVEITVFTRYGELLAGKLKEEDLEVEAIRTNQIFKVIRALSKADLFVVEGGPFFEDPIQATACFGLVSIARCFRLPVIAYGVTVFSFRTRWGRLLYRHIFNKMNSISVREAVAEEILKELKVTIRCIPLDGDGETGTCLFTGKPSSGRALFAKAY